MSYAMNEAGTQRIGEDHNRAKLSDADVYMMFTLEASGMSRKEIAEKMETTKSNVSMILNGQRRVHVVFRFS